MLFWFASILTIIPGTAFAAEQAAPSFFISTIAPLALFFLVFYIFILRPQSKKQQEFNSMLDSIKIGTKVATAGGIIGMIKNIDNEKGLFTVTISDNVDVLVYKKSITNIFNNETQK